ncbi:DHHW family protein [Raineya sp.]|jgi:hypothetical protein
MQSKIWLLRVSTFLFVGLLMSFGVLFALLPKQEVSEYEKRRLTPIPQFSWKSFWKGTFMDSLDLYVADNFPFREGFVQTNFTLASWRGWKNEDIGFYKQEVVTNAEMLPLDSSTTPNPKITNPENEIIEGDAEKSPVKGVMIYNAMAIQLFGGTEASAKYCAEIANFYQKTLQKKAQVYLIIVPTHQEFYLPHKYRHSSEKKNIEYCYSQLDETIKSVDVVSTLYKHKNEYIYFNTDHHWTGLGAYYAYVEFCKKAGFEPVPLEKMERKAINGFLGSLYWLTRDKRLKENIDSVVYYKPAVEYVAFCNGKKNPEKRMGALLFAEFAKGPAAYSVYFGDDFSLVEITNKNLKNGRKAMIIKNSFGNAFAPYLVSHYEQVWVVDYRYWNKNLLKIIDEHKITDVILFHYSFSANTIPDLQRIKQLLTEFKGSGSTKPAHKKQTPKDSVSEVQKAIFE